MNPKKFVGPDMPEKSLIAQVRDTMLITVFVFLGLEGASVYSRFAKTRADVGRATILGFVGVTGLMVANTLLPYAALPHSGSAGSPGSKSGAKVTLPFMHPSSGCRPGLGALPARASPLETARRKTSRRPSGDQRGWAWPTASLESVVICLGLCPRASAIQMRRGPAHCASKASDFPSGE